MAKLPQVLSDARLPATGGSVEIDARYPVNQTGAQVARAGATLADVSGTAYVAAVHAREEGEATRAFADTTQKLDTLRLDLEKDPDYANREAKFNAAARQIEDDAKKMLSPGAARTFQPKLAALYAAQAHSVRVGARKDENDALRVDLDQSIDTMLESAIGSKNVLERNIKLGEIESAINSARDTGVLTYAQAKQYHKGKLEKLDEITVSRFIRTNPGQALRILDDKQVTPNLDPVRREQLKTQAQVRIEQMSALAKADVRADVAGILDAFSKGNLRPANLDQVREKVRGFPDLAKQLAHGEYVYGQTADFATKSAVQQLELIAGMRRTEAGGTATPTDTALRDAYEKIHAHIQQGYRTDPGGLAMQRNTAAAEQLAAAERAMAEPTTSPEGREDARARFQTSLRELQHFQQTDGGVPGVMTRLLPKSTATALEENFNKLQGQQRLDFLEVQRNKYGSLWPQVLRQLDEGKNLPEDVKIIGSLPGTLRSGPNAALIAQAMSIPEKQRNELIPDDSIRKRFRPLAGEMGQAVRETMRRAPGEIEAYNDYAKAVSDVAEYLYGTKRASTPEAATRQAWKVVFDDHWATAGSVRVPKIDGQPVANPTMVAAYGDYVTRNLDKLYLAVPEPTPAMRAVPELRRLEMWRAHIKAYGALTTDRFDEGVVLRDGEGRIVRGQNGQPIAATWTEIANDREFQAWLRQGNRPNQMQPRGSERFQNMPGMLPGAQPEAR